MSTAQQSFHSRAGAGPSGCRHLGSVAIPAGINETMVKGQRYDKHTSYLAVKHCHCKINSVYYPTHAKQKLRFSKCSIYVCPSVRQQTSAYDRGTSNLNSLSHNKNIVFKDIIFFFFFLGMAAKLPYPRRRR